MVSLALEWTSNEISEWVADEYVLKGKNLKEAAGSGHQGSKRYLPSSK